MRLAIVGPGRCGKDEMAAWLAANTRLRYSGTTSTVISKEYARRHGMTFDEAHAVRHARRDEWRALGDDMRRHDPAFLARTQLQTGDLAVGIRAAVEIEAVIREGLVDLVAWIDRPFIANDDNRCHAEPDPTLEFGDEVADITIRNDGSLSRYHRRIRNLAGALDVLLAGRQ